jgi:hypothetical protein
MHELFIWSLIESYGLILVKSLGTTWNFANMPPNLEWFKIPMLKWRIKPCRVTNHMNLNMLDYKSLKHPKFINTHNVWEHLNSIINAYVSSIFFIDICVWMFENFIIQWLWKCGVTFTTSVFCPLCFC